MTGVDHGDRVGLVEAVQEVVSKTATALGIARPTVESHLRALEITHAIVMVRPFHGGGGKELVKMPKVYGFDTGFVSFVHGWDPLRPGDFGVLWEHLMLEDLQARLPDVRVCYWRDKAGHEVDFVLARARGEVDAIECKWDPRTFDASSLEIFRSHYPKGRNYLMTPHDGPPYVKRARKLEITVGSIHGAG